MFVRRERPGDEAVVHAVHAAAFRRPDQADEPVEARLADELRATGAAIRQLSLVAVVDGGVVGHVVCNRGWVGNQGDDIDAADDGAHPALGLGPLGVLPEHQKQGVGQALMHAVLGAADAQDEQIVALLGAPAYYGRFGFEPSHRYAVQPPDPAWGEHFQVRPLTTYDPSLRGTFRYAAPFAEL